MDWVCLIELTKKYFSVLNHYDLTKKYFSLKTIMDSLGDKSFQKKKKCIDLSRTKSGMENILLLIDHNELSKKYFFSNLS
jgi:hypothetical protein